MSEEDASFERPWSSWMAEKCWIVSLGLSYHCRFQLTAYMERFSFWLVRLQTSCISRKAGVLRVSHISYQSLLKLIKC